MTNHAVATRMISEIRKSWRLLTALSEALAADLGVTPSMRAVMAELSGGRARTVPDMAAERGASRQHVQKIVNTLLASGLAETAENPAHKRSVLIRLTGEGEEVFAQIARREEAPLARLAAASPEAAQVQAADAIAALNAELRAILEGQG